MNYYAARHIPRNTPGWSLITNHDVTFVFSTLVCGDEGLYDSTGDCHCHYHVSKITPEEYDMLDAFGVPARKSAGSLKHWYRFIPKIRL